MNSNLDRIFPRLDYTKRSRAGRIVFDPPFFNEKSLDEEEQEKFLKWSIELDLKLFGRETPFSRIKLKT